MRGYEFLTLIKTIFKVVRKHKKLCKIAYVPVREEKLEKGLSEWLISACRTV